MRTDASQHEVLAALVDALAEATGLPASEVGAQLTRPPKPEMGDYAFPCFNFAKRNKQAPAVAAAQLAEKLEACAALKASLGGVAAAGPFLNIHLNPGTLSQSILRAVFAAQGRYGESAQGAGKTIVIDYSSPNIAKPFHVGHLLSTVLGASLVRIHRALGYTVVGVNHLGDWGVQCGFQFLAWLRADPAERERQLKARGLDYLCELYIGINAPAKEANWLETLLVSKEAVVDPDERAKIKLELEKVKAEAEQLDAEARVLFKRLEDGDPELKTLWERLRTESLAQLQKSYDRLGISFESNDGEAFYEPQLRPLLAGLKAKGIAVESEGALVIPMDDKAPPPGQKGKPPFIILKSDGSTSYATRDLAAALYRKKTYNFYKCLYVIDVRQSDHLRMLFKAVAKLGNTWGADCVHVAFGLMQIAEGDTVMAMTTRGGSMVSLNELLNRMAAKVLELVHEKNRDLNETQAAWVAEAVGVGAVVFWVQARRRNSNFVFDWRTATDPSGDTGPYLQYTHARACSILRKSQSAPAGWLKADCSLLVEPEELAVVQALESFPSVVRQAAEVYEPSLLASYLLNLASAFSNFLNKHRVIDSPSALRAARLALVDALRQVLAKGLGLLGVSAPEEM
jgi:arginyl-tRNA synthetase